MQKLRIIHCFRSPVGGIFRHVNDVIHEQIKLGHEIGVICDNNTGGEFEETRLAELEPNLTLGLHRLPMDRSISFRDGVVLWKLYKEIKSLDVDVLHSHGAKGGAYARLIGSALGSWGNRPARLYCPHGGSVHYDNKTISGRIYFLLERLLERMTDRLIFVSEYERDGYFSKVGKAHCPYSIAKNGLTEPEFDPIQPSKKATDFIYIGMMRDLKGVDLLLEALPKVVEKTSTNLSITLVGDGPDLTKYKDYCAKFNSQIVVNFLDPTPAREAFPLGKTLIVPSRAESMPYIVLEALASQVPMIATNAGGIPEIYGDQADTLINTDDLTALTNALCDRMAGKENLASSAAMAKRIKENFSSKEMAAQIMQAYAQTL